MTPWLKRDDYGINVFPSIHASTIVEACKMGLTTLAYTTPSVRDISTFAVLCSVIQPFLSLYFMKGTSSSELRRNFK